MPTKVSLFLLDNSLDRAYSKNVAELVQSLSEFQSGVVVSHRVLSDNLGYGAANNELLQEDSDFHLVLNPDTCLHELALARAIEYLRGTPDVVLLSPKVGRRHVVKAYPDWFTLALRYISVPLLSGMFAQRLARYNREDLGDHVSQEVELFGGCFLLMRTSVWRRLKGFDESFFLYFEDFDFSLRAMELGKLAYVPDVEIEHDGGDVGRKKFRHHCYFIVSAIKFFRKHRWRFF